MNQPAGESKGKTMTSHSEDEEFKKLMQGVKPLKREPHKENQRILKKNPTLPSLRPGVVKKTEPNKFLGASKVARTRAPLGKKKHFQPQKILDLHGLTLEQAMRQTQIMLDLGRAGRIQSLLIITGKGLNSGPSGGVLRREIWDWLSHLREAKIKEMRRAPQHLGGEGAILLFFS